MPGYCKKVEGLDIPNAWPELVEEIERRIQEFEQKHQEDVCNGGSGWVPRIRAIDYAFAATINIILLIWYIYAIFSGGI